MSLKQQQELEALYLLPTYGRKPVQFVRGNGILLYDDNGKEYLDFLAGIGAVSVGHANPRVTAAIQGQAAELLHVGNYFYIEGRGELARRLSALLNDGEQTDFAPVDESAAAGVAALEPQTNQWRSFFANSGAEAIEAAIKLARRYGSRYLDGATTIISAKRSFHGRTLAALAATGQPSKQEAFQPLPAGFKHVPLNDIDALREMLDKLAPAEGLMITPGQTASLDDNPQDEAAIASLRALSPSKTACAVLLEVVQGEGGVWPCDDSYLRAVRALTAERGILLIIDEIQTGFYRTGKPFAFQHAGIQPDIVTLAKGIANGVPIGVVAASGRAAEGFEPGDHGSTFGGSPLAIAAALATLDELLVLDAGVHAEQVGAYLATKLAQLPLVTEVRGRGLMRAVQLSEPVAVAIVDAGLEQGLVLNAIGDSILRFLPPLCVSTADVDVLIEKLRSVIADLISNPDLSCRGTQ
jgi:acetylornithine aminotransferase